MISMKAIATTIIGITFAATTNAIDLNKEIPKHLREYKSKPPIASYPVKTPDGPYFMKEYDVDGDGLRDVMECYKILKLLPGNAFIYTQHPGAIVFDLNGDKKFSKEEILKDEKYDGLNGNEKWAFREYA